MSGDLEERMGQLCDELQQALDAGQSIDTGKLAERFAIPEPDVQKALQALQAMHDVLGEDAAAHAAELAPPQLSDDYEVLDELGRGGMGVVYRAHQKSLDRDLAVKVLRPGDLLFGDAIRRFEREAKSLAKLRHRHIVSVHEVGQTDGFVYFTMDLIDGCTLAERLQDGPMPAAQAVQLVRQIGSAMAYAHSRGVLHRDLKPGNILLDEQGDAFVCDFGLARELGGEAAATMTGQMLGTPAYMSPEQALGDRSRIGEATDVYALGAILYECLSGAAPFAGLPLAQLMHAVLEQEPTPLRKRNPQVPIDLEVICDKAMHKDPAKRYATVQALAEDLERFSIGKEILARRRSDLGRAVQFVRRNRRSVVGAVVPALLLLACAWWFVLPVVLRERTLALAEGMREAGSVQAAADTYVQVYGDMEPDEIPFAERTRYLRALADGIGWLIVQAGDQDRAKPLIAEAERVLPGRLGSPPWHQLDQLHPDAAAEMRRQYLRLQPLIGDNTPYPFSPRAAFATIARDLTGVGREADLVCTLGSIPVTGGDDALTAAQRTALTELLPLSDRLPYHLRQRLYSIARLSEHRAFFETVDLPFLERLVELAGDPDRPLEVRHNAACMFHQTGWLPFLTHGAHDQQDALGFSLRGVEPEELDWLKDAWQQLDGLDRHARLQRRLELVAERITAAAAQPRFVRDTFVLDLERWFNLRSGRPFGGAEPVPLWWAANRDQDPRERLLSASGWAAEPDRLDAEAILARMATSPDLQLHHLLSLTADPNAEVPFATIHNHEALVSRWHEALALDGADAFLLRVAVFGIRDSQVRPRLIAQRTLEIGRRKVACELPLTDALPFLETDLRFGRKSRRGFLQHRGAPVVHVEARLRWSHGQAELTSYAHTRGSMPRNVNGWSSYGDGNGDRTGPGLVSFVDGRGWQVADGHARFDYLTVATFAPRADGGLEWTEADWREAIRRTIAHAGSGKEDHAVNSRDNVGLATFFVLPEERDALRAYDATMAGSSFGGARLRIRKASRLLARDEQAIAGEIPESNGEGRSFLDTSFWMRLAGSTASDKIRAYAVEKLEDERLDAAQLRTLASFPMVRPLLSDELGGRVDDAPSPLVAVLTPIWWKAALWLCNVLFVVVPLLRARRGVGSRRGAGLLVALGGLLLLAWDAYLFGVHLTPIWIVHIVHNVGIWMFCWRATRSVAWQLIALFWTLTTLAQALGYMDHPPVVWAVAAILVVTLPMHRAHVGVAEAEGRLRTAG